jgi:fused signal recognition particle receptor
MGLINFLKNKFAHRKEEKQETASPVSAPVKEEAVEVEPVRQETPVPKEIEKPTLEETTPAVEPTPAAPQLSEKEKEKEIEDKYVAGLDKSRIGFTEKLKKLANSNKVVNQEYFDSLERILIEADVGVSLSLELIKETSIEASAKKITSADELNDLLIDKMFVSYANKGGSFSTDITFVENGPTVLFLCGVNGVGKTTTVAKLAHKYKERGKKVLLVAGDTFRAGAVEQLTFWAGKVGVDILSKPNGDPASLCYDAMKKAVSENYDLVLVDTAGRLQNKKGLMDELSKMVRVIKKVIPEAPHESLLILDANTGQNGIDQASVFKEAVALTGIIITKMDGTSKGGIILSIRDRLALPVKFIGLGEKMDDLEEFDLDKYLYGLLVGDSEESA